MNVFEDLIGELKDENLLEDTIIDVRGTTDVTFDDSEVVFDDHFATAGPKEEGYRGVEPAEEKDFYHKRAIDEISCLQMVEHILSGVEREHMKTAPAAFDDFEVKKALHKFLQVPGGPHLPEKAVAELLLLDETQKWSAALSARDRRVSVANLRRFCENSKPVLSSQALLALARLYRNSPFSEDARKKFDFVMTRLFTREIGGEKRRLLFQRPEMTAHIKTVYENWSSNLLYATDEDEGDVSLSVTRFDDLAIEAETAETFDELLDVDFFNKVRIYKEELGDMFFVPEVASAAFECNLRIGNKYIELIAIERAAAGIETIEKKYGFTYDQIVSNAAGKTLNLVNLLREWQDQADEQAKKKADFMRDAEPAVRERVKPKKRVNETAILKPAARKSEFAEEEEHKILGLNKWVFAIVVTTIFAAAVIYFVS